MKLLVVTTFTRLRMTDLMNVQTEIYKVVSEKQKLDTEDAGSSDKVTLPSAAETAEHKRWSCC